MFRGIELGKIRSMLIVFEDRKENRDEPRFMAILELIRQVREDSRLKNYKLKVEKRTPDFQIVTKRIKSKEERKHYPKGDEIERQFKIVNLNLDMSTENITMKPRKISAYVVIKYKDGNQTINVIDALEVKRSRL